VTDPVAKPAAQAETLPEPIAMWLRPPCRQKYRRANSDRLLEDLMMEQVEWFSGSTDIEVTKSSEDRLVPVRTAVHPREPLGLAGIPSQWKFSSTQSEG
jgi:hypothetical protein